MSEAPSLPAGGVRESSAQAERPSGTTSAKMAESESADTRHTRISPESSWLLDVREIWRFRELLWTLAGRDLKVRYKQTVLGVVWVIFQPLVTALIFTFVVGTVLRVPFSGGVPTLLAIFAALTGFYLFRDSVNRSSTSLVSNRNLVSKIYFPRVLLPMSGVLNALVDFAVSLSVFAVIWIVLGLRDVPGDAVHVPSPGLHLLLWPVCVAVLLMISLGFGMAATALAASWRDVGHVVPVILMILLYASPVMYDIDRISNIPGWGQALYFANPLAGLLAAYRWSLIGAGTVSWGAFAWSAICGVLLLTIGVLIFKRMERRFADVI